MTYPPTLRQIADDAPLCKWQETTRWREIVEGQSSYPGRHEEFAIRHAATAITQAFMGDVMRHMKIERRDTASGRVMEFTCVALRYDQLMDLLYRAYVEGQSSTRSLRMEIAP